MRERAALERRGPLRLSAQEAEKHRERVLRDASVLHYLAASERVSHLDLRSLASRYLHLSVGTQRVERYLSEDEVGKINRASNSALLAIRRVVAENPKFLERLNEHLDRHLHSVKETERGAHRLWADRLRDFIQEKGERTRMRVLRSR